MAAGDFERKVEEYRTVLAPSLCEAVQSGENWSEVSTKAMAALAEINFGLTDEEYRHVVGNGPDELQRYEKLCKVAGWLIVHDGTTILHTPGEILRGHSSGWPGLTPPEETKPLIELLASDDKKDFKLLKRTLEEMLARTDDPFED